MASFSKESRSLGYQSAPAHQAQTTGNFETEINKYSSANPTIQDTPPPYSQSRIEHHNMANTDLEAANRGPNNETLSSTIMPTQSPGFQHNFALQHKFAFTGCSYCSVATSIVLLAILGAVVVLSVYFTSKYTGPCLLYSLISFSRKRDLGSSPAFSSSSTDYYAHDSVPFKP